MKKATVFLAVGILLAGGAYGVWSNQQAGITYVVVKGDTLGKIAKTQGVTVAELREWNGLRGDRIEIDQQLRVYPPSSADTPAEPAKKAPAKKRSRRSATRPASTTPSGRTMPKPKPCLPPPSADDLDEQGAAASEGLSRTQIDAAIRPVLPSTADCLVDGVVPQGELLLDVRVACSGVVSSVQVARDPGWDPQVVACMRDVFRTAAFPAHALPDGEQFTLPVGF